MIVQNKLQYALQYNKHLLHIIVSYQGQSIIAKVFKSSKMLSCHPVGFKKLKDQHTRHKSTLTFLVSTSH